MLYRRMYLICEKDEGFLMYIWGVGEVEGCFVEIAMLGDREIIG